MLSVQGSRGALVWILIFVLSILFQTSENTLYKINKLIL